MKIQNSLILAAALAATTSAYATPVFTAPEIVLTENSDTSLSATINGSPLSVYEIGADDWFVYGLGAIAISGSAQWSEPDGSGDVNTVGSSLDTTFGLGLLVKSDVSAGQGTPLANNTDDTTDFSYFDTSFFPVNVTFNDLGDSSSVPDAATTMPLLGAAAGVLFGFARRMRK